MELGQLCRVRRVRIGLDEADGRFFWGTSCLFCVVYCYFRLPEPAGRTFAEIDLLFERKTPARAFSKTKVSAFDHSVADLLGSEGEGEAKDVKRAENAV